MKDNFKRERLPAKIRKLQIQKASIEVFMTKGFPMATMTDINKCADVSTGCLYYYYKKKEDILYDLISEKFNIVNLMEAIISKSEESMAFTFIKGLIIDKLIENNDFRAIYTMFLIESKNSHIFKKLHDKIKQDFFKYFYQEELDKILRVDEMKLLKFIEVSLISIEILNIEESDLNLFEFYSL